MGQSMVERPPRVQNRNHQETWEVPAEELEKEKVARKAPEQVAPEQAALDNQADQGEEAPAAVVVAAMAAEVEETLLKTLQKTPTKAKSVGVMMTMEMMIPRTIRIRSSSRILQ